MSYFPMSSSLAYDLIREPDSEPEYVLNSWTNKDGNYKKFKDLKKGDTFFFISYYYVHDLVLFRVIEPLKVSKGRFYIKFEVVGTKKVKYINFGRAKSEEAKEATEDSFAWYGLDRTEGIIGTSLGGLKKEIISKFNKKLEEHLRKVHEMENSINEVQLI